MDEGGIFYLFSVFFIYRRLFATGIRKNMGNNGYLFSFNGMIA